MKTSIIVLSATRLLVLLLLVFSVFMLLRGHNEPGGGFIGGLIAATGFVLYAIACGVDQARNALRLPPRIVAMSGLGIAVVAGVMSALFGDPLFTGQWLFIGATTETHGIPLSSVLLFDIGVYLVVLGAILTLVFAMEEEI
ncbi:MAG: Na+/H+ antiporter subunit B [Qingshengfaniella sp.]